MRGEKAYAYSIVTGERTALFDGLDRAYEYQWSPSGKNLLTMIHHIEWQGATADHYLAAVNLANPQQKFLVEPYAFYDYKWAE